MLGPQVHDAVNIPGQDGAQGSVLGQTRRLQLDGKKVCGQGGEEEKQEASPWAGWESPTGRGEGKRDRTAQEEQKKKKGC